MLDTNFRLDGKNALVTGASRGIGYHLCLELAQRGAHVIALARHVDGLEKLDDAIQKMGGSCTLVPLDLHDLEAIDALGSKINERWQKLDIFFANAAILGTLSPVGHIEPDTFDEVIKINLTCQWRLIRTIDPLLQRSTAGRAVVFSSSVAHSARAFWGAYAASKAALETIARCWANETKQNTFKVNLVDPGATRTDMRAQAVPGEDPMTLPSAADVARSAIGLVSPKLAETGCLFRVRQDGFVHNFVPCVQKSK